MIQTGENTSHLLTTHPLIVCCVNHKDSEILSGWPQRQLGWVILWQYCELRAGRWAEGTQ